MTDLYFDCTTGVAGDMFVAAMIAIGVDPAYVLDSLRRLPLDGVFIDVIDGQNGGISGKRLAVKSETRPRHRHLRDLVALVRDCGLPAEAESHAVHMFERICEAEGRIHGLPAERVHLHEVGAADSIVDIVGAAVTMHAANAARVVASPVHLGSGRVHTEHGELPVPAPATADLLSGFPVFQVETMRGEFCTPTGALIISEFAEMSSAMPIMRIDRVGYGLGTREVAGIPNVFRVFAGSYLNDVAHADVVAIECNVDNTTPEVMGYAMEKLYAAGALDVAFQHLQMKKNRPGILVRAIVLAADVAPIVGVLFSEIPTIGVRYYPVRRIEMAREAIELDTPVGPIRFKKSSMSAAIVNLSPEYDSCVEIARRREMSLRAVFAVAEEVAAAYRREQAR